MPSKTGAKPRNRGRDFSKLFGDIANRTSQAAGKAPTLLLAAGVAVVCAIAAPLFQFSDTWQLVINTGPTIVTFLMVFLIQNSQNRDSEALQIKLDELIRAVKGARNEVIDLEEMDEQQLNAIRQEY